MIEVVNLTPVELLLMMGIFYLGRVDGINSTEQLLKHKKKLDNILEKYSGKKKNRKEENNGKSTRTN